MKFKTIFRLSLISIHPIRKRCKDDYPRFHLSHDHIAFYPSLKQAEEAMPTLIKEFKAQVWNELHSCRIEELPIGVIMNSTGDNYSEWVYDENGAKLDERLFPTYPFMSYNKSVYRGRKSEQLRFKPGDVAQYGDQLCVVDNFMRPFKDGEQPYGDSTDDGYTVWVVNELADNITLDKDSYPNLSHAHPQSLELFPPRYPISEKIQRRINNIRQHFGYDEDPKLTANKR